MPNPMIRIHNTETNEVIDREMTADELKNYEAKKAIYLAEKTEAATKAQAKAALLTQLGITEEQAKLLLS